MEHINLEIFTPFVQSILSRSVSDDFAKKITEIEGFMERVREIVESTSAWKNGYVIGADDVDMAIGRTIFEKLKILEGLRK